MFEMKLPDIGEGVAEAELIEWKVSEGQWVKENEALGEFLTDKASVDIPSPIDGKVSALLYKPGDIVNVGEVFIQIDQRGEGQGQESPQAYEDQAAQSSQAGAKPAQQQTAETSHSEVKTKSEKKAAKNKKNKGKKDVTKTTIDMQHGSHEPPRLPPRPGQSQGNSGSTAKQVCATPAVRAEAKRRQVDLSKVKGSGPEGRVLLKDLDRSEPSAPDAPDLFPPEQDPEHWSRQPFLGIRRRIAENMQLSKRTIPHFTYVEEVDVTKLEALRQRHRQFSSPLPFIVLSCIRALQTYPILNASLDQLRNEIVFKGEIDLGIAVATDQGLIVPVIKQASAMNLEQLSSEIKTLSEQAKAGSIAAENLKGGSFTISSLGKFGGLMATPIIRHPEVAILGVHAIKNRPRFDEEGQLVQAKVLNLSLSVDHRLTDGIVAAEFIQHVKDRLEIAGFAELVDKKHEQE